MKGEEREWSDFHSTKKAKISGWFSGPAASTDAEGRKKSELKGGTGTLADLIVKLKGFEGATADIRKSLK